MKNNKLWITLMSCGLLLIAFSCMESNIEPLHEDLLEKGSLELSPQSVMTSCDIQGNLCVNANTSGVYTYVSSFSANNVNWSVQSGNISIGGGQGTSSVTLNFASNFNGGSIYVIGSGPEGAVCSESLTISKCTPPCTVPTILSVHQDENVGVCPGQTFRFYAVSNGSTTSGTYQWSVNNGASIISGQGTSSIYVASPSSGTFRVNLTHVNSCQNTQLSTWTLSLFDMSCGI